MAHRIETLDLQVANTMAWHKKTLVVSKVTQEIVAANFEALQLRKVCVSPTSEEISELLGAKDLRGAIDAYFARAGTGYAMPYHASSKTPIGQPINPETYTVRDLAHIMQSVRNIFGEVPHEIASVGTYRNRTRYAVSIRLPEMQSVESGERQFDLFLTVCGSLDKSEQETFGISSVCVVCDNTFQLAMAEIARAATDLQSDKRKGKQVSTDFSPLQGGRHLASVRHTRNMGEALRQAEELTRYLVTGGHAIKMLLDELQKTPINSRDAKAVYAGFLHTIGQTAAIDLPDDTFAQLVDKKDGEELTLSTRRANEIDEMIGLFQGGLGNRGETGLDLLSGFTERFSRRPLDSFRDDSQLARFVESSENGVFAERKTEFFNLLIDKPLRLKAFERGSIILERSNDAANPIGDVLPNLLSRAVGSRLNAGMSLS